MVKPGANPKDIALAYEGVDSLTVKDGELVVNTAFGEMKQTRPYIYQEIDSQRREINGGFRLLGSNAYGFEITTYNPNYPLVIDPTLVYSTYLGGSSDDIGFGIAVDSSGSAYVTGGTGSADFPTTLGAFDTTYNGAGDVFVTKLRQLPQSEQPQLKAPWAGRQKITQGNNSTGWHRDHGTWDNTYAIDVALSTGDYVLAPADGIVEYVDDDPGGSGGKEIAIQHIGPTGRKVTTVYLHLSEIGVEVGDSVRQGQIIAKSGATGERVTGPHLHFHIWSRVGNRDAHTIPIERLYMKPDGGDFREYDARIANRWFESNN